MVCRAAWVGVTEQGERDPAAFFLPVMHPDAMRVPGRCLARGVRLLPAPGLKVDGGQHGQPEWAAATGMDEPAFKSLSSVGPPWPLAAHQPVTSSLL